MLSLAVHTALGIARADRHDEQGRSVAYVVRWEVRVDGQLVAGSKTFPIHGDGTEARRFAWAAAFEAGEGRPPESVAVRSSWPVVSVCWRRAA